MIVLAMIIGGASCRSASPKAEFQDRANAICRDMKTRGDALSGPAATAKDADALPAVFRQMKGVVDDAVRQLRALAPPPGDEGTVTGAIDALERSAQATEALADSATKDPATMQAAVNAQADAQVASDAAMTAYGLSDCVFGSA
jgi:hypothetical protein